MIFDIVILIFTLCFIVFCSELFTNGIEWLGQRLQLSEGVVGSVLAAVGTALPETLIPIVALIFFGQQHGAEVGIGAIAGAPFMLSTLTFGICGITCLMLSRSGKREPGLEIKKGVIKRDLRFFIGAYTLALVCSFLPSTGIWRPAAAVLLVLIYPFYLFKSFSHEGEVGVEPERLYLDKLTKIGSDKLRLIVPQVVLGLLGISSGAYFFVQGIQNLSDDFHIPPLVLSLIVCPVATELPEKINSVLWLKAKKDTLALGNVSGALVFQSCFPVAFGVAFTAWQLDIGTLLSGIVAIASALFYLTMLTYVRLQPKHLALGALAYACTIFCIIKLDLH